MNKPEIKKQLEEIVNKEDIQDFIDDGKQLIKTYQNLLDEEESVKNETQDDETLHDEELSTHDDDEITPLIEKFKSRMIELEKSIQQKEKKNLEIKQGLISRLRNLIQHEENIGALFSEIKEIQESWKDTGNIPRKIAQQINQEYHNLIEQFFYNINIYKELKENDLKKNYSLKNQVVHKMKELLDQERISVVQDRLRNLQNEWAEIGPTYQENWEKLKNEFYTTQNEVYEKIRVFYEERKVQQAKSIELKKELLQKAIELKSKEIKDIKTWDSVTKEFVQLQNDWKSAGHSNSKENKTLWVEFRSVCNDFFDQKSAFFKSQNKVFKKNEGLKLELIEKAKKLIDTENFKMGTKEIIELQKKWKQLGHAGRHSEHKLWKKFKAAGDEFFEKKESFFKEKDAAQSNHLQLKEKLIEEITGYKLKDNREESSKDLKEFSNRFSQIGDVPFSKKDKINKSFRSAMNEHYSNLGLSNHEKDRLFFETRIDQILSSQNPGKLIRDEKDRIRKKINGLTSEINQYENNLGFFKNSKGAEALLGEVNAKIEKAKDQITNLKNQLKSLPKEEA